MPEKNKKNLSESMISFLRQRNSNYLLFFGLCLLVTGLPLSLFLTSLSQFFIVGSFFLEGNFKEKTRRFINSKAAVLMVGFWLLHVIGLLWTQDFHEGIKDVRIKLPILFLPIVLSGAGALQPKQFKTLLWLFILAVFSGSLVSMAVLKGFIHTRVPMYDIREIFILGVSHIRFALFTCLAVIVSVWLLNSRTNPLAPWIKFILVLMILWLVLFLFIIESVTGISVLLFILIAFLLSIAFRHHSVFVRTLSIALLVAIPTTLFIFLKGFVQKYSVTPIEVLQFDKKTKLGNSYFFDTTNTQIENGYRVYFYICDSELRTEWNKRSKIPFDSLDERKQPLKSTLIRFLTSKGEYKDAESVSRLTEEEIRSIEHGIANVYYQHLSSIKSRMLQILWEYKEYQRGGDPSGHSVTQRIEFWKAALQIILEHPLTGVGTGDMPAAYREAYSKMNTKLMEKYRLRAHNQYLAIGVGLGIPVLLYFLFTLIYPLAERIRKRDILFLSFWLIFFISMFTEDTLETQAGATFAALFWSLFLFSGENRFSQTANKIR